MAGKIRAFFYGRNGFDDLAKHSLILSIVIFLIYGFLPFGILKFIFSLITYGLMIYAYFRILSKKVYKRKQENHKY